MIDRILNIFTTVSNEAHGSLAVVFLIGIIFGVIIQYSRVAEFEKIAGFAMLKDTVVPKMLFLAIGITSIGLYFMIQAGYASYHPKPIILGGLIIGGIIFGVSMAILGKCPGTGPISISEGRIDVLVAAIGGVFGGLVFTVYFDFFKEIMGKSLGKITLIDYFNGYETLTILIFGIFLIGVSIAIPLRTELDEEEIDKINE
ncbi:membrane protein, putative [hydrothermal vent metagenome]|uniref:Membrane protein, putative n=1 Tax=hydrothermal vent metagenome TaxID=652676 RepID=A0A1W1EIW5_9ZZZZ